MSARLTITCREIVELMTDYVEGAMSDPDRQLFERHLVQCPPCRDYLQQLRSTVAETGRLARESVPELTAATETALLATFRNFRRRNQGEGGA